MKSSKEDCDKYINQMRTEQSKKNISEFTFYRSRLTTGHGDLSIFRIFYCYVREIPTIVGKGELKDDDIILLDFSFDDT